MRQVINGTNADAFDVLVLKSLVFNSKFQVLVGSCELHLCKDRSVDSTSQNPHITLVINHSVCCISNAAYVLFIVNKTASKQ